MTQSLSGNLRTDSRRFVCIAAGIAAMGGLVWGYDTGVIAGAILFINQQFVLSPIMEAEVVSTVLLGAMIGAAFGGTLSDRIGRRTVLILTATVISLGAVGTALAPTIAWLVGGRFVLGIGVGIISVIVPLYIAEASPKNDRGWLVFLFPFALTCGILISYLADYALSGIGGWRWMIGLGAVPAIVFGIGMWFLPESPRWLASQGFVGEARNVLRRCRGTEDVSSELQSIQQSLGQQKGGWAELVSPWVRPALIVGIGLAIFRQVTGLYMILFYAPIVFEFAGIESTSIEILATVGVGVVNVVMTIVAMRLVDQVGRRPLLLVGTAGMVFSLGILGLAFMVPMQSVVLKWVVVGCMMLDIGSYAIGWRVYFLIISEIYPLKIRGMAMGITTAVNWGVAFVVALTFLTLIQTLGRSGTFWLYALFGIGAWFFVYFLVPETKGRSLEEIEAYWRSGT